MSFDNNTPSTLVGDSYPVPPPTPLRVLDVPVEGDVVKTKKGKTVRLVRKISEGGEGVVYETNLEGFVAKVYHKKRLTADLKEKLKVMVGLESFLNIDTPDYSICWPVDLVLNSHGEVVGYVMRRAKGEPLMKMLHPATLLKKYPHVDRAGLAKIAVNVLKGLETLYNYKVLMGDVNGLNFIVDSETLKVYLIDSDSWQIGPFVCKVGRQEFSHPDWLSGRFENKPREPRSEAFAIAVLVFMILLPGKHPFSHAGGEDMKRNIVERTFPYVVKGSGVETYENAPAGPWRYIWSHTPQSVRYPLHDVLKGIKEPETFEDLVAYVRRLVNALERYRSEIVSGARTAEVFPNYYYIPDNTPKEKLRCPSCNKYFEVSTEMYNNIVRRGGTVVCHYCYKIGELSRELKKKKLPRVIRPNNVTVVGRRSTATLKKTAGSSSLHTQSSRQLPPTPPPYQKKRVANVSSGVRKVVYPSGVVYPVPSNLGSSHKGKSHKKVAALLVVLLVVMLFLLFENIPI